MKIKTTLGALSLAATLTLTTVGCGGGGSSTDTFTMVKDLAAAEKTKTVKNVLTSYADIALDNYTDALTDATTLQTALTAFTTTPTEATLAAAKTAWKTSRESYGQTEIFRLSNGPIDVEDGWAADAYGALEGQINAWPLDENMIDYTTDENDDQTSGNIIDTAGTFTPSGDGAEAVDITTITVDALTALNENGGDANVATGYHAIEFLLWGQDQDYASMINDNITHGAQTAGERPISDYTSADNAQRRKDFLNAAAEKLVNDLTTVRDAWNKTVDGNKGLYRSALLSELTGDDASKNIEASTALKDIMAGMGVFIKSELANERIMVAVLTPSEEDEHSCFSDNTHRDIVLNYQGFTNVLKGTYNGKTYGTSAYSLLSDDEKEAIDAMIASIDAKAAKIDAAATAANGEHFDYQIKPDSVNKENVNDTRRELRTLGDEMIKVAAEFGIALNTDDVTDADESEVPGS